MSGFIKIEKLYTVNFFDLSPTFHTNLHKHDQWEFFYVDGGEVNCLTEEESKMLKAGDIIFHSPGEIHNTVCNGKKAATMFNVLFYCDSPAIEYFKNKTLKISERAANTLKALMDECLATYRVSNHPITLRDDAPLGGEQMSLLLFEELLLLLMRELEGDGNRAIGNHKNISADPIIIEEICDYMRDNLYGKLTLNDLSEKFHFSKTFLCDIFKKHVGCSPISYYLDLKLTESKRLLREDNITVRQISEILGFESPEYFSRYFKKRVGHSPRNFRKMLINNASLKKKEL